MVLELALGHHPFVGLQSQVIAYQIVSQGVAVPESCPAGLAQLCKGVLTRAPDNRRGWWHIQQWPAGESPPTLYDAERHEGYG
jgi:hypothetical protein